MEKHSYFVIDKNECVVYKNKNSKFIAYSFFVENETEIKQFLTQLKSQHPSANHHCYAWCLGTNEITSRANDDGEPSNTAGKPILNQLQHHQLSNCLVVVVRYFGGTLLGVNGLINAYKMAASQVLAQSQIHEVFKTEVYKICFEMDDMNKVMRAIKYLDAKIMSNHFETSHEITIKIRSMDLEKLNEILSSNYKVKILKHNSN